MFEFIFIGNAVVSMDFFARFVETGGLVLGLCLAIAVKLVDLVLLMLRLFFLGSSGDAGGPRGGRGGAQERFRDLFLAMAVKLVVLGLFALGIYERHVPHYRQL